MAHFAQVNDSNKVVQVIVADQEFIDSLAVQEGFQWIQTSYNTRGGVHIDPETGVESQERALRKNYAGIGHTYDEQRDAFIPPKKYDSWVLNEQTCLYVAPEPYPNDGEEYVWNEGSYTETGVGWILAE